MARNADVYQSGFSSTNRSSPLAPLPGPAESTSPVNVVAVPPDRGKPRPIVSAATGGPTGTSAIRPGVLERAGAQYRITVNMPPVIGEAAYTQANGRIIQSYPKAPPNFWGGTQD